MASARPHLRIALTVLATLILAGQSSAGFIAYGEALEMMIEAQGADGVFIGRQFGPDRSSTIHFTSNLDVAGKRFSYAASTGATYLGQSLSLSATGAFNSSSGLWEWTSAGSLGGVSWRQDGTTEFIDPPISSAIFNIEPTPLTFSKDYHGSATYEIKTKPDRIVSSGSAEFTVTDLFTGKSVVTARSLSVDSVLLEGNKKGAWNWNLRSPDFRVASEGFTPAQDGGDGTFAVSVVAVPEPGSWALLVLGGLTLAGYQWRFRKSRQKL